jgi:hypothetical protein
MKRLPVLFAACALTAGLCGTLFAQTGQQKLLAYWSFDSVSGQTFYDGTGHGYNASWTGSGIGQAAGLVGQALSCSGTSYELTVANSRDSFALSNLTIEAWFNTDSIMDAYIFDYQYVASGVYNGYGLYLRSDRLADFAMSNSTKNGWWEAPTTTALTKGKWYHLAATYDGSAIRIFVNGTMENQVLYSGGIGYPVAANARIACQTLQSGVARLWDKGRIDELKLYNYALSADTIRAHYQATRPPTPVLIPCIPNPTYNRKPLFKWLSTPRIAVYRLQIDTVQRFQSPIISIPLSDTFYMPGVNLPVKTIYWRACNDADTSTWSAPSSVTILDSLTPLLIPYTPDPTLNRRPTLMWHSVSGSGSYTIQIDNSSGFTSPVISDITPDTFYKPLADLPVGIISWRVKSTAGTQYSPADTFVIQNDSIPMLIPVFPDTQSMRRPELTWHRAVGASSYRVQVDTVGNFAHPVISLPLADTFYLPQADLPMGKLFWRVSGDINSTRYSAVDTFWILITSARGQAGVPRQALYVSVFSTGADRGIGIACAVDKPCAVSFEVFSLAGKRVASLYAGNIAAGNYRFTWTNGDNGTALTKGGYILRYRVGDRAFAKRIVLM